MFNKEEFEKIMTNSQEDLKAHLIQEIKNKISSSISYGTEEYVRTAIKDFLDKEVAGMITEYLEDSKAEIIESIKESVKGTLASLGTHLLQDAEKKMVHDWERREIYKRLFGI